MKKLILILISCIAFCCCLEKHRMMTGKVVRDWTKTDSSYIRYGYYKEVKRTFNYIYKDSIMRSSMIDTIHGIHNFINEYGDTVYQIYIDYTNYPRREE